MDQRAGGRRRMRRRCRCRCRCRRRCRCLARSEVNNSIIRCRFFSLLMLLCATFSLSFSYVNTRKAEREMGKEACMICGDDLVTIAHSICCAKYDVTYWAVFPGMIYMRTMTPDSSSSMCSGPPARSLCARWPWPGRCSVLWVWWSPE